MNSPPQVKVQVFGHRDVSGYGPEWPLVSEFETAGGMHPANCATRRRNEASVGRMSCGACFYVAPIDYSGFQSSYAYPRAGYQHLLILHNFDWDTRRGEYIHIPYGGKIEISAL